jgi:hypothetical protein
VPSQLRLSVVLNSAAGEHYELDDQGVVSIVKVHIHCRASAPKQPCKWGVPEKYYNTSERYIPTVPFDDRPPPPKSEVAERICDVARTLDSRVSHAQLVEPSRG